MTRDRRLRWWSRVGAALMLVPVLLLLQAPLLAAVVPTALLTLASLDRVLTPAAQAPVLIASDDPHEAARIARAIPVGEVRSARAQAMDRRPT